VPADHFGALVYACLDRNVTTARAVAMPFVPRARVDGATLDACTAFGSADLLIERLEQYVARGASKFIVRPMRPPERMLEQIARLSDELIPHFHRR
jgi:hypothetical protein